MSIKYSVNQLRNPQDPEGARKFYARAQVRETDFGKLQYQVESEGADTEEEFKYTNISKVNLQFRPGIAFREQEKTLKYEKVLPRKVIAEAAKATDNTEIVPEP